ncbi:MAG: hypothetical protein EOP50_19175 [Sphingobacteriales bacterium]|nr:MAG: hypothetical protein EOP50_19175 [Sphingobacteriales bacterium]
MIEAEAQAVDEAMGRLGSAKAVFEKTRTEVALKVGAILSTAQGKLSRYGDGVFIRWVQERLGLQKTTAYKWLRLHEHFGDCPQCVQNIDVSGLYILSVDSGPAHRQALADALASAQKGRRVKRRSVIQMLQAHRDTAISEGWDEKCVPQMPGEPTTFQKLRGIWLTASVDDRRKFMNWALERARHRKQRGMRRKACATTTA